MALYAVHNEEDIPGCEGYVPIPLTLIIGPDEVVWCGQCGRPRHQEEIPEEPGQELPEEETPEPE